MRKLSITITEKNGSERVITVELENELADWLMTQPAEIYEDFILFEYQARCVERKETRHTQSLDHARASGFDVADESEDVVKAALQKCDREALQVAMNVKACVKTSSSRSTPTSIMAMCKALVPLTQTTAFFAPVYSATISSKRSTNLPTLETKVVSIHSSKYFFSFPTN